MASNYGPNFGVRRADEHQTIREGRFKTPATGTRLRLGTPVEIDPANPGFMRQAAASVKPRTGVTGLVVSEDQFLQTRGDPQRGYDWFTLGTAPLGKYTPIWSGAGCKFWFLNTAERTLPDGRVLAAVNMFEGDPAVGEKLGWTGTKWAVTADDTLAFMEVVRVDSSGLIEATLLK